jgi:hypothetical protein
MLYELRDIRNIIVAYKAALHENLDASDLFSKSSIISPSLHTYYYTLLIIFSFYNIKKVLDSSGQ